MTAATSRDGSVAEYTLRGAASAAVEALSFREGRMLDGLAGRRGVQLEDLVIDDGRAGVFRVHRSAMTVPEILALERERIFDRCWRYVGNEAEIPSPGDYRRRTIAGRSAIFARGNDGAIRTLLNTCTHRGARVCRQDEGNARTFQCFYHAWTFDNRGELV